MPGQVVRNAILVSFACWTLGAQAAPPARPVVRSAAELGAVLASGQRTPLDAFTPYGKRSFLRSLYWSERGLGSIGRTSLVRELDAQQIAAVLALLDASAYLPTLTGDLVGPPLRLPTPAADIEARYEQLLRFDREQSQRRSSAPDAVTAVDAAPLERRYAALFGEGMSGTRLRTLSTGDLPLYFDAAALVSQGRPASPASRHLGMVYEELRRRGIDTRRSFDGQMLGQLLEARHYEKARAFVDGKPHLAGTVIPTLRDPLGPAFRGRSVYRYDAEARSLTREALPQPAEAELVMVVDAGCRFSANALAALHDDAAFRARLQEVGLVLITPPRAPIAFHFIEDWNKANPTIPIRVPYSVEEWQAVDIANVPRFFLLKEGKVVDQLTGWPPEGNQAALIALLDRAAR